MMMMMIFSFPSLFKKGAGSPLEKYTILGIIVPVRTRKSSSGGRGMGSILSTVLPRHRRYQLRTNNLGPLINDHIIIRHAHKPPDQDKITQY
jgi:hypothetical protein